MSDTMDICGLKAERGQKLQTYIPVLDSNTKIPITIINGQNDGPTLLITAGIHGGEYPGIAAAIEISQAIEPEVISGMPDYNTSRQYSKLLGTQCFRYPR